MEMNKPLLLVLIVLVVCFTLSVYITNSIDYLNSDFFTFWLSGHLVSQGEDPYNAEVWVGGHHQFGASWIPNQTFIYPMPVAQLFAPLGRLSTYQALVIWNFLTQLFILVSVFLILRIKHRGDRKNYTFPIIAGLIFFRPAMLTLRYGQLSGLLLLLIAVIIYFWEKEEWYTGALLMPFLCFKPNLGVPIFGLLVLYLLSRKKYRPILAALASGIVLILVGCLQDPNWLIKFWQAGNTKLAQTFGYSPTVWGVLSYWCKYEFSCVLWAGLTTSILILLLYGYILLSRGKDFTPSLAIGLVVVITLLVTPYTWPYDQVLLVVSIIVFMLKLADFGYPYLLIAPFFLLIDILAIVTQILSVPIQIEIWNTAIPMAMLVVFLWLLLFNRHAAGLSKQ